MSLYLDNFCTTGCRCKFHKSFIIISGIPKMKIPALEPLSIPNLEINRKQEALDLKLNLKDLKAWGGTNFIVKNLK